ncbi:MAG: hypothetical protein HY985_05090 [Magnetospirillum sp.]|nr:hypothetical protein [Magnetospirillum sp.]
MSSTALLLWAKGPGFAFAAAVFLFGVTLRVVEMLWLRRRPDRSVARGSGALQGLRTVVSRFLPAPGLVARSPVVHVGGMVFHLGLFAVVFLYGPHIAAIRGMTGLDWPGLPTGAIDGATVLTIAAMIVLLIARSKDPVRRLLTTGADHLAWTATLLPLLTGFLLVNRVALPFETLLAVHLLSVELLLVLFPFTTLMHAVTFAFARYYAGAIAGRKGAHS